MKKWWHEKPYRLIQTNLREIDADLNVDDLIDSLLDFSADVLLFNTGGIIANYPTKLPYQYVNPHMHGDLVGNVIERIHASGLKYFARFDFSKLREEIIDSYFDWLYLSPKGERINYNGQYHLCINSQYQQELCIEIIREVISNYPIDGFYMNMVGYQTKDYSGTYYGICQCENCKKRFFDTTGLNLPTEENSDDPVFRTYDAFRAHTSEEQFNKIMRAVRKMNPNIAIASFYPEGVDIARSESATALRNALPEWNYHSTENVKNVISTWEDKVSSNTAVHFLDFPFRHSAVPPALTALRLAGDIANGAWLDYYVIGTLNNQDDRACFSKVKDLFAFYGENIHWFCEVESKADICVLLPKNIDLFNSYREFKGIVRILAENHILFDVLRDRILFEPEELRLKLKKYSVLILPDIRCLSNECVEIIDQYVREGGSLFATGFTSTCDELGNDVGGIQLQSLGVSNVVNKIKKNTDKSIYFKITEADKKQLNGFPDLDLVYLNDHLLNCELAEGAEALLQALEPCNFGPPEKAFYTKASSIPGLVKNSHGKGKALFLPWCIGRHYEDRSNHAHSLLVRQGITELLGWQPQISTNASPLVEITVLEKAGHHILVNCVNHSGQLGTMFHEPLEINEIEIAVACIKKPVLVKALKTKKILSANYEEGILYFKLPVLRLIECILIAFE